MKEFLAKLKRYAFVLLLALVCLLAWLNRSEVETNLLFTHVVMPQALLVLGTTSIGFVMGFTFSHWRGS